MVNEREFHWERPANLAAFGAAIRRERENKGLTLDMLAAQTGISKPYLSNIETARAPGPPSEEKLRQIAAALGLDEGRVLAGADWLRTPESVRRVMQAMGGGSGTTGIDERQESGAVAGALKSELQPPPPPPPRRGDGTIDLDRLVGKKSVAAGVHKGSGAANATGGVRRAAGARGEGGEAELIDVRPVPVINRVAAGKAVEFTDLDYPAGVADSYVPAPDLPEAPVAAAFAVRVRGDSMMPEYAEGEILIVGPAAGGSDDAGAGAVEGEDCVVRLGEMEHFATTFKRVFYERDGAGEVVGLRLVPLNPAHAERRVTLEQVTGIYPVMYRLVKPSKAGAAKAVGRKGEKTAVKKKGARGMPVEETPAAAAAPPRSFTTTRVEIEND